MIQTFLISFKSFKKNKQRNLISFVFIFISISIITLFKYHLKSESELSILLNNIFQFSGIFSALLITFIISKIFQIRQEKLERLREIIVLSNKVTDFRRIAKILIDTHDFWNSSMRSKMEKKYRQLTYFHLHIDYSSNKPKDLIYEFYEEREIPGANFYLALKSLLVSEKKSFQLELYDEYDYNIVYPFKMVSKWVGASSANSFFYYLDHKWHSYKNSFNLQSVSKVDAEKIVSLCKKINESKYKNTVFDRELLVEIGNDFESLIFPRLYQLTYQNENGIPETLIFLIRILISTMIFGVLIPLVLSSIKTNLNFMIIISSISIIILCLSIIYFVLNFKKILENEIYITRENI